jgi:hypothetical protein
VGSSSGRVQEVVEVVGDGVSVDAAVVVAVVVAVAVEAEEAGIEREGENRALFSAE